MADEKTSKRVAAIAGKINRLGTDKMNNAVFVFDGMKYLKLCTLAEFKALAASALTQAKDKPKKRPARLHGNWRKK